MDVPKKKKKEKKGIFGVRSTIKLFSFRGELWPEDGENSSEDDDEFKPNTKPPKRISALAASAANGRAPMGEEGDEEVDDGDGDAIITEGSSESDDEYDSRPVVKKKVSVAKAAPGRPRAKITLKIPKGSATKVATKKQQSGVKRKAKAIPVTPKAKKARKKEPYYEAETQELQADAAKAFQSQPSGRGGQQHILKSITRDNRVANVERILPNELLEKIFKFYLDLNAPMKHLQSLAV